MLLPSHTCVVVHTFPHAGDRSVGSLWHTHTHFYPSTPATKKVTGTPLVQLPTKKKHTVAPPPYAEHPLMLKHRSHTPCYNSTPSTPPPTQQHSSHTPHVREHSTPASSKWLQSLAPKPLCAHSCTKYSLPSQNTSSNQIGPDPDPK